jgi:hypothetical protein
LIIEVQRHFFWLKALQEHRWRDSTIPSLWGDRRASLAAALELLPPPEHTAVIGPEGIGPDGETGYLPALQEAALAGGGSPYLAAFAKGHYLVDRARSRAVRPSVRDEAHWKAFGAALTQHLRLIHPTVRWMKDRPVAAWSVRRPADVLWVQLWDLTTGGATMRQCRHCHKWFALDHRGKIYCSRVCTNRASAAASYKARRRKGAARRRRTRK